MSETVIPPEQASQALKTLLEALRPILDGQGRVAFYEQVAVQLSAIVDKQPPWGWRYVRSVEAGTVKPSRKFCRAVYGLGATLDGLHPMVVDTQPVQVYAQPGTIRPGSLILAESKICASPGCTLSFVPRVPWQKYCCPDCRKKSA